MSQQPNARQMRWWIPAVLVSLAVTGAMSARFFELPFIEPILVGIGVLLGLLVGLWYIFFTGLPWKRRWLLFSVSAVVLAGAWMGVAKLTRVEGSIGGSGIPRLVWKWAPRKEGTGEALMVERGSEPKAPSEPGAALRAREKDFPQFLGPNRSSTVAGVSLARDWEGSRPAQLWRQPIGLGWSAFAVAGGHAITQEQRGEAELVVCYALHDGQALWAHTNLVRFSEALGGDGPRATPTISQGRVYAMGAAGILDCLEEATGRAIWSRDVLRENSLSNVTWGKSCSPLLAKGMVVVTGGNQREKTLLAYDSETGRPVWQAGRDRASYSSPQLVSLCGQEQIVVVNAHSVTGHLPADGRILWEYAWPGDYAKATQPVVIDTNGVFIAAGYGVGCVRLRIDCSAAGLWSAVPVWKNRNLKPKFTNLVRQGQFVYGLDDGVLACIDLENGDRKWKDGRYGHGQILLVGDLLLVQAESGEVVLVEISPGGLLERARMRALQGKTWNNPALSGDLLLVRNDREAACYRLPPARSQH